MLDDDVDGGVFFLKTGGELLGAIYGAVLAAGAAEGDAEVGKVTLEVFVDALCDDRHSVLQEEVDGRLALQKFDDGTVLACVGLVLGVATGIGEGAAVEDVAAAIARRIVGKALFVTETLYGNGEGIG